MILFWEKHIRAYHKRLLQRGEQTSIFQTISLCRDEEGQALVEAVVVMTLSSFMALALLQPALTCMVRIVVGYSAGCLARAAETESSVFAHKQDAYALYIKHKLEVLPEGDYFFNRASLKVTVAPRSSAGQYSAKVSVAQKPLPFVGGLLAQTDGLIHIQEEAVLTDATVVRGASHDSEDVILEGR